jgi:hypothetical protein
MSRTSTKQSPARAASAPNSLSSSPPPALLPERADDTQADALLERDGAVILTGRTDEPSELVAVAAAVLGARLRQLLSIPRQAADAAAERPCTRRRHSAVLGRLVSGNLTRHNLPPACPRQQPAQRTCVSNPTA